MGAAAGEGGPNCGGPQMAPEGILNFFLGKRGWLKRNGERYLCASWVWGCISEVEGEN